MAPSGKKGKTSQEKLSKLCAKSWWKLKMNDRTKHNEAMKIQLLSPFLYRKLYQSEVWINWAKSSGLLNDNRLMEINELSMEELMYTELIELAVCYLQEKIQNDFSEKPSQNSSTLEGVIDNMDKFQKETSFTSVITKLRHLSWFQSIKSQLIGCSILDSKIHDKCDAAIVLVAWQVSYYMQAIYRGEELLKEFEENRTLDPDSEKRKEIGNNHYKDGKYEKAINTYTNIICNKPYLHIVYGNRAICYIKKEKFRSALADGRRSVTLDPKWDKGQIRYADALKGLGYSKAAFQVLLKASDICEPNKLIVKRMIEIRTEIDNENKVSHLENSMRFHTQKSSDTDDFDDDYDDDDEYDGDDDDNESDDVPDLVTDDSDESFSDCEDVFGKKFNRKKRINEDKSESKPKKPLPSYMVGTFIQSENSSHRSKKRNEQRDRIDDDRKKEGVKKGFKNLIEKASNALLNPEKYKGVDPIDVYETAKAVLLKDYSLMNSISTNEAVILSYAHAVSYLETQNKKLVVKSISMFNEITSTYKDIVFPLPYFGIGRAYMKMRQFPQARRNFDTALVMDIKPGCLTNCSWPGTDIAIEETGPGRLRRVIEAFMLKITKPLPPDAECFLTTCRCARKEIYFDELDFNGCIRIQCDKEHRVEFHTECWSKDDRIKYTQGIRRPCLKAKCDGFVTLIESYRDNKGKPEIEFKDEKFKDLMSGASASPKSKKKKKNKNSNNNSNNNNISNNSNNISNSALNVTNATNGEEDKENSQPSQPTSKNKKKKKKNSGSGPDSPDTIRRNASYIKYTKAMHSNFSFSKYENIDVNSQTHTFEIYFFVETILSVHDEPYLHIENNQQVKDFVNNFNEYAKSFLRAVGGVRVLLSKCTLFAFDEKQPNIVYLSANTSKYKNFKKGKEQFFNTQPPDCDEPLFTQDNLIREMQQKKKSENITRSGNVLNLNASNGGGVSVKGGKSAKGKSSRPEIEEVEGDDEEEEEEEEDDDPPTVSINVGLQVDLPDIKRDNKDKALSDLNKKLASELKILRTEKEDFAEDLKKIRVDYTQMKLRCSKFEDVKAAVKLQQSEKRDLLQKNILLDETIKTLKEEMAAKDKIMKNMERVNVNKVEGVKKEIVVFRKQALEKESRLENVIHSLNSKISDETKRAEIVEIALLESRRDLVVIKYQQQAHVIQNTINQMQYLSHLPEMVRLRKLWEDYKLEYQSSYEKMQDEFTCFIQSVKQGKRLDSLPPSKYSQPPSYPQSPMPPQAHQLTNGTNSGLLPTPQMMQHLQRPLAPVAPPQGLPSHPTMNASILGQPPPPLQHPTPPPSQMGVDIAAQLQAIIKPDVKNKSTPPPPPPEQKKSDVTPQQNDELQPQPLAQAAYTTQQLHLQQPHLQQVQQHSDSEDSEASNRSSEKEKEDIKYNKFFEKVILKLGSKFPTAPRDELLHYFNEYRKQGPLSGQKIDDIVLNIEHLIRRKRRVEVAKQTRDATSEKKKPPRVQGSGALNHGGTTKRQRANHVSAKTAGGSAATAGDSHHVHNIFGLEEPCVICYEDLQADDSLLLHCGHTFHRHCIHCWLKEQRTCPVCRVLALLPDEYPALG